MEEVEGLKRISVLFILVMLITVLYSGTAVAGNGSIHLIPHVNTVKKNMVFGVDIWADNMDNLYGLQLHLRFKPSQLEVVGFKPEYFGWEKDVRYYELHRWDNDKGTFDMVFTCYGDDLFFSGNGKLGTIEFKVKGTDEQLTIDANYIGYPGRTCIGVNNKSEPAIYTLYDSTICNDNTPPCIDNVVVMDNSTIRIEFNEPLDEETALDVNNYVITPDLGVKSVHLDENQRNVTLITDPQVGNRLYELAVRDIQDLTGNKLPEVLREKFRGAMKLWLEAAEPMYNKNKGIVQLKAGPVEEMTQLHFYIKYDDKYLTYEGARYEEESFAPGITEYTAPTYKYFHFRLNPIHNISQHDDWVICEFEFTPQDIGSTKLEFMKDSRAPRAFGLVDGESKVSVDIVVEHLDEMVDILQSYQLTGYIKLVAERGYLDVEAYLVRDELEKIRVNAITGAFQLEDLIPGVYTVRLSKPGYLTMDYSFNVQHNTEEEIFMTAGDLNDDGRIDILDIADICTKFSTKEGADGWCEVMDFNNDKWIDIVDISIVARNYGKISNVDCMMR